jgi:hypothetical protein
MSRRNFGVTPTRYLPRAEGFNQKR